MQINQCKSLHRKSDLHDSIQHFSYIFTYVNNVTCQILYVSLHFSVLLINFFTSHGKGRVIVCKADQPSELEM